MVLLGDEAQVGAPLTPFGDSANLDIVFNVPMVLLGEEAQLEAPFSPFGDSANLDAR